MIELRGSTDASIQEFSTRKTPSSNEIMLNLSQHQHEWQHPDSCGSACMSMAWNTLIKLGVLKGPAPDQASIHKQIFDPVWDGSPPEVIEKYLVKNDIKAKLLKDQTLEDTRELLDQDKILIVLIRDDFPTVDNDIPCGHYVILQNVDFDSGYATLIDPSNAERYFSDDVVVTSEEDVTPLVKNGHKAEKRPNYKIKISDLRERFHDEVAPGVEGYGYVIAIDTKK